MRLECRNRSARRARSRGRNYPSPRLSDRSCRHRCLAMPASAAFTFRCTCDELMDPTPHAPRPTPTPSLIAQRLSRTPDDPSGQSRVRLSAFESAWTAWAVSVVHVEAAADQWLFKRLSKLPASLQSLTMRRARRPERRRVTCFTQVSPLPSEPKTKTFPASLA